MKQAILISLMLTGALMLGADADEPPQLGPSGLWPLCQGLPAGVVSAFPCPSFEPGAEPDLLRVHVRAQNTVAFAYELAGVGIDGAPKVWRGSFLRADDENGWTNATIYAGMNWGGALKIKELGVIGEYGR